MRLRINSTIYLPSMGGAAVSVHILCLVYTDPAIEDHGVQLLKTNLDSLDVTEIIKAQLRSISLQFIYVTTLILYVFLQVLV